MRLHSSDIYVYHSLHSYQREQLNQCIINVFSYSASLSKFLDVSAIEEFKYSALVRIASRGTLLDAADVVDEVRIVCVLNIFT